MRVELFVISDRREEPKSFISVDGEWNDLGMKTRFFSKKSKACEAMQYVNASTKDMDVETVVITVE